jgi:acyl-coenzyme A thioesterase PaaI-like protein
VHGGMVAMMFDVMCGITIHSIGRPISRTAFLHVDYRNVTPIDVPLTMRGWASKVEGRKTFVNAEMTDPDGTLLAENSNAELLDDHSRSPTGMFVLMTPPSGSGVVFTPM